MDIGLTVGSFDRAGGIERVTVELALAYRALGHDVTIYATEWDAAYQEKFRFVRVNAPARPAWLRTWVLPRVTAKRLGQHDWVHGHGTSTMRCDLLTFHSVHQAWCEAAIATEGLLAPRAIAKRVLPFHRLTIATEQAQVAHHRGIIHGCSPEVAADVIRCYGAAPAQVVAEPWGVDLDHFRPDAVARARERTAWGLPPDVPVLLLVANELARKGFATIAGALARMARKDVQFVVVGREDPMPFRAIATRLGVADRVHFLGPRDPAPCYQAADLFVMPSSYEGWGLVVAEALACGLPVVASQFPAAVAMLQDGRNGLLLDDPRDEQALAFSLERALASLPALAAEARPSAEPYSWLAVGKRLVDLGARSRAR